MNIPNYSFNKLKNILFTRNINLKKRGYPKIKSNALEHPAYLSYENTFKLFNLGIVPVNVDAYWSWVNYPNPKTIPAIRITNHRTVCPIFRKEEFETYVKDMEVYFVQGKYDGEIDEEFKGEYVVYKKTGGRIFIAVDEDLETAQVKVLERMFEYENDIEYWVDEWFDYPESM